MIRSKLLHLGATGLISVAGLCGRSWAWDDAALPAPAERLLPLTESIPRGLDVEALDILGPNWTAWAEETAGLISQLYEEAFDDAAQLAVLEKLQLKRATIDAALADPAYAPIHPALFDFRGKLERRLDVYAALRIALRAEPTGAPPSAFPSFQQALNDLESSLIVMPNGSNWLPYYNSEGLNQILERGEILPADEPVLKGALERLQGVEGLTPEQQEFLHQPMFATLVSAIQQALATSVPADGDAESAVNDAASRFLVAMEEYEETSSRDASARMQAELKTLRAMLGDAASPLAEVVRRHYQNYNLHVALSEQFMQRFFADQRSESGGVSEYVEDVYVSGCQWTNTTVGVDIQPCATAGKFVLTIDGNNRSQTTGEVCSATVYNTGVARFRAEKDILFDGEHFTLCPSRIGVNASNCTYDAETCLRWVPIAGNIARNFALEQAAERKPDSDAYARRKISREVRGRFDRETAQKFAEAEQDLQNDLYQPLEDIDLRPEYASVISSDVHMALRERLMRSGELAAGRPPQYPIPDNGLLAQVHQSLLSNGADRMDFAGQKLTQKEMDAKIRERLDRVFKDRKPAEEKPAEVPPADETPEERAERLAREERNANTRLVFDVIDPISFRFEDGEIVMILRAGLERPGEEDIPTQIISVPLKLSIEGDQIVMTRGLVGVKPAQRPDNIGEQIARARIMIQKIEDDIPERRTQDAKKEIQQEGKTVVVQVRSIVAEDGWLTMTIE